MITGQPVGVKNRKNFSSVKIFLAIRNKKPFLDITYRLVLRGGGALKKKLPKDIIEISQFVDLAFSLRDKYVKTLL